MIEQLVFEFGYLEIFVISTLYFLLLYFVIGWVFNKACKTFEYKGVFEKIDKRKLRSTQVRNEIKNSLVSIVIFGFSALPVIWCIRNEWITVLPNTLSNVIIGLIVLTVWNELHFYIIHRVMHLPFFYKHFHHIHHKSVVSNIFSVFSFHWFEAVLLSTVPLSIGILIPLPPLAIFIFPIVSIFFNFAGHCNYRWVNPILRNKMATNHINHHSSYSENFGFASSLLDRIFNPLFKIFRKR